MRLAQRVGILQQHLSHPGNQRMARRLMERAAGGQASAFLAAVAVLTLCYGVTLWLQAAHGHPQSCWRSMMDD